MREGRLTGLAHEFNEGPIVPGPREPSPTAWAQGKGHPERGEGSVLRPRDPETSARFQDDKPLLGFVTSTFYL